MYTLIWGDITIEAATFGEAQALLAAYDLEIIRGIALKELDRWWDVQFQKTAVQPRAWAYLIKHLLITTWEASTPEERMAMAHPALVEFAAYQTAGVTEIPIVEGVTMPVTSADELVAVWKTLSGLWMNQLFGQLEGVYRTTELALIAAKSVPDIQQIMTNII